MVPIDPHRKFLFIRRDACLAPRLEWLVEGQTLTFGDASPHRAPRTRPAPDEKPTLDSDDDEEAKPAQSIIDTQEGEPVDGTDEEVEVVVQAEERALIGETAEEDAGEHDEDEDDSDEDEDEEEEEDDDEDDSDSPNDDETPRRGFQARLERLRASSSKGKGKAKAEDFSDDDAMSIQMTWADEDDDYLEHIEVRCPCACSVLWS